MDEGIAHPTQTEVEASVGVGPTPRGFGIEVELRICLPGLARKRAISAVRNETCAKHRVRGGDRLPPGSGSDESRLGLVENATRACV
jgi:hypothetical protein